MVTEKNVEYLVGELKIKDDIVMDLVSNVNKLEEKIDNLVNASVLNRKPTKSKVNKCHQCDFETVSSQGLKVHMKRKHTEINEDTYICHICDKVEKSNKDLKAHIKTHAYKIVKYKCEDCEFVGARKETMNVHLGKCHSGNFVCGLCEFTANTLEDLETHLFTCEMYECNACYERTSRLADLMDHLRDKHEVKKDEKVDGIMHIKMERSNFSEVSCETYSLDELLGKQS